MAKDYYETLGIEKGVSKEEIKKAYKKLAKKYHPDISKEPDAEKKFKEINEAANVLLDDQKKKQYDTYGSSEGPQGFGGFSSGGGFNPEDFGVNFDDLFEQFGFGGFGRSSSRKRKSENMTVHAQTTITLEDVYFGVEKEIRIEREVKCDICNGKGAKNSSDVISCSICGGTGYVIELQRSILGSIRTQRECPTCHGSGKQIKHPCDHCHGKGSVRKNETVKIKIPKGVEDDITLRVSGKGNYNKDTDSYGDLYLKIYVEKNNVFDVESPDLYMSLDINFIQAILGDEVEFKHFNKTLSLKIPEGTQAGTVLRLKGKGLPYFNYSGYGDLYVKINVEIPTKTTKEQKRILLEYVNTLKDKGLIQRLKSFFS